MAEVVEVADGSPGGTNNQSAVNNNSFHELNSLKTLLGKTWSDLSNIMTRYHAQIVEKHEELEATSLCTDATRISKMDNDLKMLRTENGRLVTQILDSKSENTKLRTENRKLKDEVTMKDTLIEKIQNQMSQEALDYQSELASLKEILEARSRGAELTAPLIASPDTQPAKRRKVSIQQLPAPRKVATVRSPRVGVSPGAASVTPTRADVTPARTDVTPAGNLPSTSSVSSHKIKTFKKPSSTRASDSEQSATEDSTSQNDGGFVKLDEVGDESNLEELEGQVSEQEEYVQGEASALTDGLESGQEQSTNKKTKINGSKGRHTNKPLFSKRRESSFNVFTREEIQKAKASGEEYSLKEIGQRFKSLDETEKARLAAAKRPAKAFSAKEILKSMSASMDQLWDAYLWSGALILREPGGKVHQYNVGGVGSEQVSKWGEEIGKSLAAVPAPDVADDVSEPLNNPKTTPKPGLRQMARAVINSAWQANGYSGSFPYRLLAQGLIHVEGLPQLKSDFKRIGAEDLRKILLADPATVFMKVRLQTPSMFSDREYQTDYLHHLQLMDEPPLIEVEPEAAMDLTTNAN